MRISVLLLLLLISFTTVTAQVTVVNKKGTVLTVDSSKWRLTGSNIYNKNSGSVGIGTNAAADTNAALEVKATNKGILIPRVALTATTSPAPLGMQVAGMMVYNTATAGAVPNNVSPGFYYSDGAKWVKVSDVVRADTTNDSWSEDAANTQVKLSYKSDGITIRPDTTAFVVKDNGNVGLGLINPAGLLDVKGKVYINNQQTIYNAGALNPGFLNSLFIGNGGQNLVHTTGTEGYYNTAVGDSALASLTTGVSNVAFGKNALLSVTTSSNNIAIGVSAMKANTLGGNNIAIGGSAMRSNITSGNNVAIGNNTLSQTTAGGQNVVIGPGALSQNNAGNNNVAVGYEAGFSSNNGGVTTSNTLIGSQAGRTMSTGSNNTLVGNRAGYSLTTGSNNTIIGLYDGTATLTNNIVIADGSGNQRIRVLDNGYTGLGTTTPAYKLHVAGQAHADSTISAPNYTATVQATATGSAYTWNLDLGANTAWTLAAGANTLTINNAKTGMFGLIKLTNAGTSTITLPTGSKVINGGAGVVALTQTASAVDILTFYYDGTNYWWTYGNNYN